MKEYRRGDLVFDVLDSGPADGPPVVLLHGAFQLNTSWDSVIPRLTAEGYRCLAPNQRGYSLGARPTGLRNYRISQLAVDVDALIDASGAQRLHLVGYDFGATVAWQVAQDFPDRLKSLSTMSVPHSAAFMTAQFTSRQGLASRYIPFFQLPRIPEWSFNRGGGTAAGLAKFMRRHQRAPEPADRDAKAMAESGAVTAALNWYRAIPLSDIRQVGKKITVPTMYIWSDADTALLSKAAHTCGRYVSGEYRFEVLEGVTHWILDEQPDAVADLLLEWFAAHPN
jgi:pimeloyl-ACP methyl ester carboxylesterase